MTVFSTPGTGPTPDGPRTLRCRRATADDVEGLARIRTDGGWSGGAPLSVMSRYLAGLHHPQHARAPRVIVVAESDLALIGYIAGHLTHRFGCDGELQWLFVSPEHRGCGIADALLRELAAWFHAEGAPRVCVNVEPDNARARAFYARHGARTRSEFWLEWTDIATVLSAT